MSRIRGQNTGPEKRVRATLHRMGYRFRLHRRDLPGTPDIVLPRHNAIVFVHGCFWHLHSCKAGRVSPSTNADFWRSKRLGNFRRYARNRRQLKKLGWKVAVVWECQAVEHYTKALIKLLKRAAKAGRKATTKTVQSARR